jgi:hypothetical protein
LAAVADDDREQFAGAIGFDPHRLELTARIAREAGAQAS